MFHNLEWAFHVYKSKALFHEACYVSTVAQNGQIKPWLQREHFVYTIDSPEYLS